MQEVFKSGSKHDQNVPRTIMIKIEDNLIEFFFYEQYLRQQNWVEEETDRRLNYGGEELTEDEKGNHNFYWIDIADWKSDRVTTRQDRPDNWHTHMYEKNWFTDEMYDFIEKHTF